LSYPHNSPIVPTITIAKGANYVRFDPIKKPKRQGRHAYGIRGRVVGFSAASRRRLLHMFNQIPKEAHTKAVWIDLTYPGKYPGFKECKRHLDAFSKRIRRKYPACVVFWRLELQRRGAPHFHLMVYGVKFIPKAWLSLAWFMIVGSGDMRHLRAGTRVGRIKSFRQAIGYASKYIAKNESYQAQTEGRAWGILNRANLDIVLLTYSVDFHGWFSIKRAIRSRISKASPKMARIMTKTFLTASIWFPSDLVVRMIENKPESSLREYCTTPGT